MKLKQFLLLLLVILGPIATTLALYFYYESIGFVFVQVGNFFVLVGEFFAANLGIISTVFAGVVVAFLGHLYASRKSKFDKNSYGCSYIDSRNYERISTTLGIFSGLLFIMALTGVLVKWQIAWKIAVGIIAIFILWHAVPEVSWWISVWCAKPICKYRLKRAGSNISKLNKLLEKYEALTDKTDPWRTWGYDTRKRNILYDCIKIIRAKISEVRFAKMVESKKFEDSQWVIINHSQHISEEDFNKVINNFLRKLHYQKFRNGIKKTYSSERIKQAFLALSLIHEKSNDEKMLKRVLARIEYLVKRLNRELASSRAKTFLLEQLDECQSSGIYFTGVTKRTHSLLQKKYGEVSI